MKTIIIDAHDHRHDGALAPPGTRLELNDKTAAWLVERGKAHYEPAPAITETNKKGV